MDIPLVFFGRTCLPEKFSSVTANGDVAAQEATQHLIDTGSRRIAFIGGPNHLDMVRRRKHGYLEALRERGIPIRTELIKCHHISFNSGLSDTHELLQLPEPPDAILAAHGLLATSALLAVTNTGKRIPDEVAIVGYMSDWVSEMSHPRVSFVKQNLKEIGTKAFRLLLDQINGDDSVQHVVVKARLELRDSTKKT